MADDSCRIQFLNAAIVDIANWIRFSDAKVGIIMAAAGALLAVMGAARMTIYQAAQQLSKNFVLYALLVIAVLIFFVALMGIYYFGIRTLTPRFPQIRYLSCWFLPRGMSDYTFEQHKADVLRMNLHDIIENMTAELYKLNDINRQKNYWSARTIKCFMTSVLSLAMMLMLLFLGIYV